MDWIKSSMFILKISMNYLKGRKRFFFRSANILSLAGIIIGVFSLLVVSSVMNGFDSDMRSRIIGSKSEIKIHQKDFSPFRNFKELVDKIAKIEGVKSVAPVCENELMFQNRSYLASSISLGVDYSAHSGINNIFDKIIIGNPDSLALSNNGLIIGLDLSLSLSATVGEYIQVYSAMTTEATPFGLLPRSKKMKVIGIFISGLPEYDRLYSYMSLENGQYFSNYKEAVSHLEVKTYNPKTSYRVSKTLKDHLGEQFLVEDWSQFEANLFNAIKMEKVIIFFVLILMVILASFNMIGNFIKLVYEKKVEIGILKALGASDSQIVKIFMIIGTIIGITGAAAGTFLALILLIAQKTWNFINIPLAGFPLQTLPVELRVIDFILVPLITVLICFITTLRPSRATLKIEPIKIIRD
jgi:lipoprotein-releasing system permease protein